MSKSGKPPAFQFYAKDWISSKAVRMMNPIKRGYYIQLMAEAWDNVPIGHLPNEPELLRVLAGEADQESWNLNHGTVLEQFKVRGKFIYSPRLVAERKKQITNKKNKRKAGTISANKRKENKLGINRTSTEGATEINSSSSIASSIASSISTSEVNTKPSARKLRRAQGKPDSMQVAKTSGESRHSRSEQTVKGWYADWAKVDCPWGPSEGANLSKILKEWPGATDEQFTRCLENIAKSDCIPIGARPHEWLGKLPKFLNGPLDQFWKAKGAGNGQASKDAERNARNKAEIIRGITGQGASGDAVHSGPAVPERDHERSNRVLEVQPDRSRSAIAGADS